MYCIVYIMQNSIVYIMHFFLFHIYIYAILFFSQKNFFFFKNLKGDEAEAKRLIQEEAEETFKVSFNVICSNSSFSFVTHTNQYCQAGNKKISCYAFVPN